MTIVHIAIALLAGAAGQLLLWPYDALISICAMPFISSLAVATWTIHPIWPPETPGPNRF
jgi:hypothetical protein